MVISSSSLISVSSVSPPPWSTPRTSACLSSMSCVDALLDGAATDELVHEHVALLTDAVGAVGRLVFDGGVPPAVEVDDV